MWSKTNTASNLQPHNSWTETQLFKSRLSWFEDHMLKLCNISDKLIGRNKKICDFYYGDDMEAVNLSLCLKLVILLSSPITSCWIFGILPNFCPNTKSQQSQSINKVDGIFHKKHKYTSKKSSITTSTNWMVWLLTKLINGPKCECSKWYCDV